MTGPLIVDTGPIVALLNRREEHHQWVRATLADVQPPLLTCEAVVAEAAYLLRRVDAGARALMSLLAREALKISFRLDAEQEAVAKLMAKYADVPMSLADACLVRMSEQVTRARVMTLDADFQVYRRAGRSVIPLAMPAPHS